MVLNRYRSILLYAAVFGVSLFVLRWLELRLLIMRHGYEAYAGAIALFFTLLGIWLAMRLARPKVETQIVEKEVYLKPASTFVVNEAEILRLGLSRREMDVLQLMAQGLSNDEIAERLFVSLNTIKTHAARLFEKLEVKRRTQAVEKAKRLEIIP